MPLTYDWGGGDHRLALGNVNDVGLPELVEAAGLGSPIVADGHEQLIVLQPAEGQWARVWVNYRKCPRKRFQIGHDEPALKVDRAGQVEACRVQLLVCRRPRHHLAFWVRMSPDPRSILLEQYAL